MSRQNATLARSISDSQSVVSYAETSTDNESFATAFSDLDNISTRSSGRGSFSGVEDTTSIAETIIPDETATGIVIAPTSTVVAPTSTVVAPTSTVVAPTSTVVAPTSTVVAPTSTVVAPTSTVVAPTSSVVIPLDNTTIRTVTQVPAPDLESLEKRDSEPAPETLIAASAPIITEQPGATSQPVEQPVKESTTHSDSSVSPSPAGTESFGEQQQQHARKERYKHDPKNDCVLFWLSAAGCYGVCGDCPCNTTSGTLASVLTNCFAVLSVSGCAACITVCHDT
ncbi:hypothetical protein BABINDRAFT_163020 [Babjeviella inositovora NRRL Y-12698]|uniref:Uncharacterized protein n=1 Tax=Babjeviella inositovora NRRL Y-12698 TaxID=984486 RepID=A0A1E3QK26_9ASCO|nr:uncharacterized protein BABINDRAFT_163020 [Babjeviella inositovora NRRL Y-12698]ODQ77968.1 hypothetical protein BABINDRAFT_163020 [Babjeviella inositovora NRRL Y-12698]